MFVDRNNYFSEKMEEGGELFILDLTKEEKGKACCSSRRFVG